MSDPRFQSVHLEGQPRQALFRAARAAAEAACGQQTLAGEVPPPAAGSSAEPTTRSAPPPSARSGPRFACYLKDVNNIYPLHLGLNTIGRLPDNDIVIRDECISRRHCAVVVHHDLQCEIHDIASKNGTVLNGQRIPGPTRLRSGDHIVLCSHHLTFHIVEIPSDPIMAI